MTNINDTIKSEEAKAHPSVAHVKHSALAYAESAETSLSQGCPLLAMYQIGIAEGLAMALQDVAGYVEGVREHTVLRTVLKKMMEIRCRVAKDFPESPKNPGVK